MISENFWRHIGFKVIMTYFAFRTCDAVEWTALYTRKNYEQNMATAQNIEVATRNVEVITRKYLK